MVNDVQFRVVGVATPRKDNSWENQFENQYRLFVYLFGGFYAFIEANPAIYYCDPHLWDLDSIRIIMDNDETIVGKNMLTWGLWQHHVLLGCMNLGLQLELRWCKLTPAVILRNRWILVGIDRIDDRSG